MAALVAATRRVGGMIKRGKAVTTRVTKLRSLKWFLRLYSMRRFLERNVL